MDKKRDREELKYCMIFAALILGLLFFSAKMTNTVYAEEIVMAEAPSNVGGTDGGEVFIIDMDNSGDNFDLQSQAPSIIYSFDDARKSAFIVDYAPTEGAVVVPLYGDGTSEQDHGDVTIINEFVDEASKAGPVVSDSGDEIYVPDSDDDCPVSALVPLATELQEYLWTKCKKATGDYKNYYAFCLGVMQHESTFRPSATHYNTNGSVDRGIMQINSCNVGKMKRAGFISSAEDLYDAYKCIDCGIHMLNNYINMFGVSESAYYAYNTGREKAGSNKNSRKVMSYMSQWNAKLFG